MKTKRPYPELYQMFAAYFHRDYDLMVELDRSKPLFPQLVQAYKNNGSDVTLNQAITELEALIDKHYNSAILDNLFTELGIEFDVSFYGYTHQQFLIEVLRI